MVSSFENSIKMRRSKEDCFHLGVKAIILNPEKKVLLLERNHPIKGRYWDIPGGRLQKGESQMDTLSREVKEETGLSNFFEIHPLLMTLSDLRIPMFNEDVGLIFSIFLIKVLETFNPILSDEHISFQWASLQQASEKLVKQYPNEFIEKLLQLE